MFSRIILFILMSCSLYADPVTFLAIPNAPLTAAPGTTAGWGYTITNDTSSWLLPLGLSQSGVVFGSLEDIFDYPVVGPAQTVFQSYAYNAPGGFGNSLGLFEYLLPPDIPAGLSQTGTLSLLYQLYGGNPDLNPLAEPIGEPIIISTSFEVIAAADVPEPGTMLGTMLAAGLFLDRRRK